MRYSLFIAVEGGLLLIKMSGRLHILFPIPMPILLTLTSCFVFSCACFKLLIYHLSVFKSQLLVVTLV